MSATASHWLFMVLGFAAFAFFAWAKTDELLSRNARHAWSKDAKENRKEFSWSLAGSCLLAISILLVGCFSLNALLSGSQEGFSDVQWAIFQVTAAPGIAMTILNPFRTAAPKEQKAEPTTWRKFMDVVTVLGFLVVMGICAYLFVDGALTLV